MKKLFIALSVLFFFSGCEKEYNDIINPASEQYFIDNITERDSMDYGLGDSLLFLSIKAYPAENISSIVALLKDPLGRSVKSINLMDDGSSANSDSTAGDSIYSGRIGLAEQIPSGQLSVNYIINGNQAAVQYIYFENGIEKFPPEISELNMRDSVTFNEEFIFTIRAADPNGYEDIVMVYFELFRPDGSQVVNSQGISKFFMNDTGDSEFRDAVAGDSIFTSYLNFPPNIPAVPPGRWKFEFEAIDRANRLSNEIIHYLEVH